MANQQQGSTADQLRSIYATPESKPVNKAAPSAIGGGGGDDLDARWEARKSRPRVAVQQPQQNPNQNAGDLGDFGTNLNIGARQIPGMITGLADIPAGLAGFDRPFDKLASAIGRGLGVDNKSAIDRLRGELSPATQASQAAVADAKGFFPTLEAYLENPRAIVADVTASLPATLAGGGIGGGVAKAASAVALRQGGGRVASALSNRAVAAGVGEGALAAGGAMDNIAQDVDPRKAAVAAVGTGIATALIATGGAHVATKLKIGDPDLVFVGDRPVLAPGVKKRNFLVRAGLGAINEGVFQEMPQGAFEQIAANWAEDKRLLEGVGEAAVASLVAGIGMGGAAGVANIGGPTKFIPPTAESGGPTAPGSGPTSPGPQPTRGRDQVTDKKLVGGIVQMAQLLDEAATPEQRKIITQHLREAQSELDKRGIDRSIVDQAESEANFAKISERIDKNIAQAKGLSKKNVDRANDLNAGVDADIKELVRIEQIYPGTRMKHMDTQFAGKVATLEELNKRVVKNRSKQSRASNKTKLANIAAQRVAQLELEVMIESNPELADRYEAAQPAEGEFNPLDHLGEKVGVTPPAIEIVPPAATKAPRQPVAAKTADTPTGPVATHTAKSKKAADDKASKAEATAAAKAELVAKATKAAAAPKLKGKAKKAADAKVAAAQAEATAAQAEAATLRAAATEALTGQPVGDQPTETTGEQVAETATPKVKPTKAAKAEAERITKETERRTGQAAEQVLDEPAPKEDRSAKARLEKMLRATQSTLGMSPEPSNKPQRVPDERPAAIRSYADRVTDQSARRIYLKNNGQPTKRGQADLDKFLTMDAQELLDIQKENLALPKRGPLIKAQYELIQDILDTTKYAEMEDMIANTPVEPLTPDEMSNIIIEAQNTGTKSEDLTDKQLEYFEMYNYYYVVEGKDNPFAHMLLQLAKEGTGGSVRLPNEKHLREQVNIAAGKIVEAIRKRRGLGSRREAQRVLGPLYRGLAKPADPKTGYKQLSLLDAYGTGDPDEVRLAKERMRVMEQLEQDIVQKGAQNDARGGHEDLMAAEPGEVGGQILADERTDDKKTEEAAGMGIRGSVNESAPFVAGEKDTIVNKIRDMLKFMGITGATPKQHRQLGEFIKIKASVQDDINDAQDAVNNFDDMAENLAMHHANPLFDAAGEAWNKATAKSDTGKGLRWAKVRNDPWVLDRWMLPFEGVMNEVTRGEEETVAAHKKRVGDMLADARDNVVTKYKANGGWLKLKEKAEANLAHRQEQLASVLADETELLRELGAQLDAREPQLDDAPTAKGPAPTINYRRHVREVQPSELPPRIKTRSQSKPVEAPKPVQREATIVEPHAVTYATSNFIAGSVRGHNPDVEVATIFQNPKKAADEGTIALLVSMPVDVFLNRVATMQAADTGTPKADRLEALKSSSYTGATAALEAGKKLTAPTLDRRLGAVKGIDHVLANVAAGSNKVHYVELVTPQQLKGVAGQLNRLKTVTSRVVGAAENTPVPAATKAEVEAADKSSAARPAYSFADHERQQAGGAFRNDPVAERRSLEAAQKGANSPEDQALIDTLLAAEFTPPRLSVTQRPVTNPMLVEDIQPQVEKYVPAGKRQNVRIVQSLVDIQFYLAKHNIEISADAAGFTHNGRVFLIGDNIQQGTAGGVLMHEVGVHLSMSPRQINQLAGAIKTMFAAGDPIAKKALDAVDGATDTMAGYGVEVTDFDENHEIVAYFVEEAVNAGIDPTNMGKDTPPGIRKFFRELIQMIRTSMRALGLSVRALSAQDIVDAAYGAADTVYRDSFSDDTPRMSLSAQSMRDSVNRTYNKFLAEHPKPRGYLTAMKHYTQRTGQAFLFSHQFASMVSNILPSAADYFRLIAKRVTAMGKFDADLQHHMNKAKEFTTAQYNEVNNYFIMSQQKEAWGFDPHAGALQPNKIDRELEAIFNGLTIEQQTFIRESFQMADALQKQREQVMRNEIEQSINESAQREPDTEKRAIIYNQGVADLAKFDREFRTRKVAWMPLRRHGEFAAVFVSDELAAAMDEDPFSKDVRSMKGNPSHYVVEFHARPNVADEAKNRLMAAADRPGKVRNFTRQAQLHSHELIPANFMNALRANLEADSSTTAGNKRQLLQAWTKLYIEQLGETSIRKSELERVNVPGFDRDMIKNFTTYGSSIGHTIAGVQMGRETHSVLQQMRTEARQFDDKSQVRSDVLNEVLERHAFMLDSSASPAIDKVMGAVSLNMLLTSPAYFIVNATQPWMLTLPIIGGNFGMTTTANRMRKNYALIARAWKAEHSFAPNQMSKLLSGELADLEIIKEGAGQEAADMMEELQQLGLFDIGIAADMGAIDQTKFAITAAIAKAHRGATHAVRTVEVFNRGVTALTAFQLATTHPEKVPIGRNGKRQTPKEYAIQQVLDTQGDYAGHNAPSIIRRLGGFGKMMTQFRKFQLIQIGLFFKVAHQAVLGAGPYEKAMARRQMSYMMGMHMIAGGALGLPMANLAALLYKMLGDDDEPEDLEVRLRQEIGDAGVADLLLKGLPAAWGVDVSAKVGMGQTFSVLPFTELKLDRDSTNAALGALAFGATGATVGQIADAAGQLSDGNYGNAFAGAMPRGIRDVTRAIMYHNEGVRRKNPTRDTAISADEFNSLDIFMQGIGLPTTKISGMQSRNRFYQNYKAQLGDRSSTIKGAYVRAYEDGDHVAMQDARNEWNDLQAARYRNGFKRQSASLLTRAIRDKRKRESAAVDGVFVDRSERGFLDLME